MKLLLEEKQAGNISNKFNDEIVAIVDKLLEYKCMSNKEHKQFLIKSNLLHKLNKYTYSNIKIDIVIRIVVRIN